MYEGPLFRVLHDKIIEPDGKHNERDVIRHNGSVVILAIDDSKSKKNPWIVMERQYRHAANQYLWELPAGKLDAGRGAARGSEARTGRGDRIPREKMAAAGGVLREPRLSGRIDEGFLAEGLEAGEAHPEEDEEIELRLVKLSDVLKMIEKGAILDGKTLTSVLLIRPD